MTNLTTIHAEINTDIYNQFIKNIDILTDEKIAQYNILTTGKTSYGDFLTEAIDLYIHCKNPNVTPLYQNINEKTISTTITIKQIHPQIHKKFRKYLQKKYNTQNIKKHYNKELNKALTLYINVIQLQEIELATEFMKLNDNYEHF